jgi:hypothetical protein
MRRADTNAAGFKTQLCIGSAKLPLPPPPPLLLLHRTA